MQKQPLSLSVLDQVTVERPCTRSWDAMPGDERRRYCDHCGKHVHNLAGMCTDEAERFVSQSTQPVCVRIERDERQRFITRDARRRRWLGRAAAVVAALLSLCLGGCNREQMRFAGGLIDFIFQRRLSRPVVTAGMMVRTPPPPPAAPLADPVQSD